MSLENKYKSSPWSTITVNIFQHSLILAFHHLPSNFFSLLPRFMRKGNFHSKRYGNFFSCRLLDSGIITLRTHQMLQEAW